MPHDPHPTHVRDLWESMGTRIRSVGLRGWHLKKCIWPVPPDVVPCGTVPP